jgi:hypothetical protein
LIVCNECGDKIPANAHRCPTCRARLPGRFPISPRALLASGLIVAAIIAYVLYDFSTKAAGPDADLVADLVDKQETCLTSTRELATLGIRISRVKGATTAEYDEMYWTAYAHEARVQQAMLFYCADMPSSGIYTVYIKGMKGGKLLATIHDGKYSDAE